MGDANEFRPPTERNKDLPVLELDDPRGPEARHAEAHELVKENAAVRAASAFWHELKAGAAPLTVRYHHTTDTRARNDDKDKALAP